MNFQETMFCLHFVNRAEMVHFILSTHSLGWQRDFDHIEGNAGPNMKNSCQKFLHKHLINFTHRLCTSCLQYLHVLTAAVYETMVFVLNWHF